MAGEQPTREYRRKRRFERHAREWERVLDNCATYYWEAADRCRREIETLRDRQRKECEDDT